LSSLNSSWTVCCFEVGRRLGYRRLDCEISLGEPDDFVFEIVDHRLLVGLQLVYFVVGFVIGFFLGRVCWFFSPVVDSTDRFHRGGDAPIVVDKWNHAPTCGSLAQTVERLTSVDWLAGLDDLGGKRLASMELLGVDAAGFGVGCPELRASRAVEMCDLAAVVDDERWVVAFVENSGQQPVARWPLGAVEWLLNG